MKRRELVQTGLLILSSKTAFGSQANSTIELGLIGCGSRGNYVSDLFIEHTGARVAALADAFAAPLEKAQAKYKVDAARAFQGLDAYQKLAASAVDAVVIQSPPYFHPDHAAAAVAGKKHVYLAKPVATDVPGCKSILESGKKAFGQVSYLVDFQTRAQPAFQEAAARIHRGEIGFPVLGHIYYHAGRTPYHDTSALNPADAELRNWLHTRRLSGDIIVEQNIHVIDVANWYLQGHPERAFGTCGQMARKLGDVSDHYLVTYWYSNGVKVDFSSAQFLKGYGDLCMRVYGSEGTLDTHYNGLIRMEGRTKWLGAEKDPTFKEGAINNMKAFIASIRAGKFLNNAEDAVRRTSRRYSDAWPQRASRSSPGIR